MNRGASAAEGDGRLVYRNTFAGLYRQVAPLLNDAQKAELRALGLDFEGELEPAYPPERFRDLAEALARMLHPELPREEGLRRIGRAGAEGYSRTLLGKVIQAGALLMGPRRTLERTERHLRTADNFVRAEVVTTGERSVRIHLSDVAGIPGFFQGMLEGVVALSGGVEPRAELHPVQPPGAEYAITWQSS